ncbi:MAG TPA: alpha/beta hydrolase [Nocardioides sp.]|uniref:alpha/beta hydrolase family protein n=1 Tax=Nocardioides sp. TaxID=35761 RepID=UPI002D14F405|nr:alpha/beta hydrolase [Nocardioides sp.]HQR25869.1 alpha/beta hydrolase [Nocardioides sp.]
MSGRAHRVAYGADESQYAELYPPEGASRGVVVVIHGGFWKAAYDASLGRPLAECLALEGWTAWNLEYRRVGNGGGVPATLDDLAAGIDALADVPGLDLTRVVALGHSAGGHLAAWSAGRARFARWSPVRVPVTAVVSLAGVLDLSAAHVADLGSGAVARFVGGPPGPAYDQVDPLRQVPLDVPVWCVHGRDDEDVPLSQSEAYVSAALAAGGRARLLAVAGDHFTVVDLDSPAWARTVSLLADLGSG